MSVGRPRLKCEKIECLEARQKLQADLTAVRAERDDLQRQVLRAQRHPSGTAAMTAQVETMQRQVSKISNDRNYWKRQFTESSKEVLQLTEKCAELEARNAVLLHTV